MSLLGWKGHFAGIQAALDREKSAVAAGGGSRTVLATQKASRTRRQRQPETEEAIAALSRAGWTDQYLHARLGNLRDEFLEAYRDSEVIVGFGNTWYAEVGWRGTIAHTLVAMGVDARVARAIDIRCAALLDLESYTRDQVIEMVVEYMAGEYKVLRPTPTSKYYYNEESSQQWYDIPNTEYRGINIPMVCSVAVKDELARFIDTSSDEYMYYYHATNWDAALNMMEVGIDHGHGRICLDFGAKPGFYITDKLSTALKWGYKKRGLFNDEVAILIFAIPVNNRVPLKVLEGEIWTRVTTNSRRCNEKDPDVKAVEAAHLVYGDMVGNPIEVAQGGQPIPLKDMKQLVSKSRKADRFLQKCLMGCFFFAGEVGAARSRTAPATQSAVQSAKN